MAKAGLVTTEMTAGATTLREAKSLPVVEYQFYHELGTSFEDQTQELVIPVDQTSPPAALHVKSHVVATAARALRSPAYLATIRRREADKIARLIVGLDQRAGDDDFVAWTHEPLEKLRQLIRKLSDAEEFADPEHEGNSCEILRQLRDTFLNDGWKRYQEHQVRQAVADILKHLATADQDDVTAGDVDSAMDTLLDLDLNPTVGFAWHNGEEEIPR